MARASVYVRKTRTVTKTTTRAKVRKGKNKGNPNHCPVCGKFMGKNGRG